VVVVHSAICPFRTVSDTEAINMTSVSFKKRGRGVTDRRSAMRCTRIFVGNISNIEFAKYRSVRCCFLVQVTHPRRIDSPSAVQSIIASGGASGDDVPKG